MYSSSFEDLQVSHPKDSNVVISPTCSLLNSRAAGGLQPVYFTENLSLRKSPVHKPTEPSSGVPSSAMFGMCPDAAYLCSKSQVLFLHLPEFVLQHIQLQESLRQVEGVVEAEGCGTAGVSLAFFRSDGHHPEEFVFLRQLVLQLVNLIQKRFCLANTAGFAQPAIVRQGIRRLPPPPRILVLSSPPLSTVHVSFPLCFIHNYRRVFWTLWCLHNCFLFCELAS